MVEKISQKIVYQSLLYIGSIVLPQIAFFVAPDLGSVAIATVFRSGGIIINLLARSDRSLIRWYGAVFICFGLLHVTAVLEWPELANARHEKTLFFFLIDMHAQAWQRLNAVFLLFVGVTCGVLLGVDQEKHGRVDFELYVTASVVLTPVVARGVYEELAKCSFDDFFLMALLVIVSALAARSLKEYAQGTRNNSYKLTYLLTVRRFITIALGSLFYTSRQRATILIGSLFVAFGVVIIELQFAVERSKLKRQQIARELPLDDSEQRKGN
jgi:hypothetical protein